MAPLPDRITKLETMVADIHKAVIGNGRPGLLDRVTVIEQVQAACPARKWSQPSVVVALAAVAVACIALYVQIG